MCSIGMNEVPRPRRYWCRPKPVRAKHVGPLLQRGQGRISVRSLGAKLPEHIGQGLSVRAKAPRDVRACRSEQFGHRRACRSLGAKRSGQGQRSVPRGKATRAHWSGQGPLGTQEHVFQSNPVRAKHVGPLGQSGQGRISGRSLGDNNFFTFR